jgi:hypothetical protein
VTGEENRSTYNKNKGFPGTEDLYQPGLFKKYFVKLPDFPKKPGKVIRHPKKSSARLSDFSKIVRQGYQTF